MIMTKKFLLLLLFLIGFTNAWSQSMHTSYEYDEMNRLVRVIYENSEVIYTYDELGNRVSMTVLGSSLTGDVNEDGIVTNDDVAALVSIILYQDMSDVYNHDAADVNKDGLISIADVTALVNITLGNKPLSSMEIRQTINLVGDERIPGQ